jgi:phosphoribosylglycinamide formyltransferase 1
VGVIGVLVSGRGTNLAALLAAGLPVRAVAGSRADAPALERARRSGVANAVFSLDAFANRRARDEALADWLAGRGVELVVLAGWMELLTPAFLDRFPRRVVNVHPSLLPAFPGLRAVEQALAAGVRESGATVHLVDEGIDTGAVLAQESVGIAPGDTAESLHRRIQAVEHRLLPLVVRGLLEERTAA